MTFDYDLTPHDIQQLSNADALEGFFSSLGFNTNNRIVQTASNLGISAEGTLRPIKKIELLADQDGLFQIYLFELTSVTVTHTRALARHFRNRTGNYLLVLVLQTKNHTLILPRNS